MHAAQQFETRQTAIQIEWSTWTIKLQPVVGGNAPTSEVDPDDFPRVLAKAPQVAVSRS